ncbi:uncharacterized protein METZ01_LOCUS135253, partial [marine metagenome]
VGYKKYLVFLASFCSFLVISGSIQAQSYKFDSEWPKLPLPNKWWMQGVTGLYVDHEDNIWVLNRPSNLN